ncbi:hypothetical protein F8M41_003455 [Gigaspora margarita]|uniref:Uncharacterized protein n=1 Tax=Gigaspora margarita TaxID=4874 RepID=A0A8H4ES55_GIGMA|nr:hypothetical protein F8M41_003455 [Gigaspora margarita]
MHDRQQVDSITEELEKSPQKTALRRINEARISENIIEVLTTDDNYAKNVPVVVAKPSTFEIDLSEIGTAQANSKALFVIHMIDTKAYKMIEYSDKFNKAKKILVCRSIKDIIIILYPKVHSLISTYGCSGAFNVKFL